MIFISAGGSFAFYPAVYVNRTFWSVPFHCILGVAALHFIKIGDLHFAWVWAEKGMAYALLWHWQHPPTSAVHGT